MERFICVSDTHGHLIDPLCSLVIRNWVKEFKPSIRVHLGDAINAGWLRNGASEVEKREDPEPDVEAAEAFLGWYRPTHFVWGNHDWRVVDAARDEQGAARDHARSTLKRLQKVLGGAIQASHEKRNGLLRLGDYVMVHGFEGGRAMASKHAQIYGNVLMGHGHRVERVPIPRLGGAVGRMIGCCCVLDQDYNARTLSALAQSHGFVYGFLRGNRLSVHQAEPVDGVWILPTEYKTYKER
jgi:predicted phosphodiesterase